MHGARFFYEISSAAMGTAAADASTVATNTSSYPGTDSFPSFSFSFATQPLQAVYLPFLLKTQSQIHTLCVCMMEHSQSTAVCRKITWRLRVCWHGSSRSWGGCIIKRRREKFLCFSGSIGTGVMGRRGRGKRGGRFGRFGVVEIGIVDKFWMLGLFMGSFHRYGLCMGYESVVWNVITLYQNLVRGLINLKALYCKRGSSKKHYS